MSLACRGALSGGAIQDNQPRLLPASPPCSSTRRLPSKMRTAAPSSPGQSARAGCEGARVGRDRDAGRRVILTPWSEPSICFTAARSGWAKVRRGRGMGGPRELRARVPGKARLPSEANGAAMRGVLQLQLTDGLAVVGCRRHENLVRGARRSQEEDLAVHWVSRHVGAYTGAMQVA